MYSKHIDNDHQTHDFFIKMQILLLDEDQNADTFSIMALVHIYMSFFSSKIKSPLLAPWSHDFLVGWILLHMLQALHAIAF